MTEPCFRMKGTTLTSVVLEVQHFEPQVFEAQLVEKVSSTPQFFTRSSLIVHLATPVSASQLATLVAICRRCSLQPMAVRGETEGLTGSINELGLADLSQTKFADGELPSSAPSTEQVPQKVEVPVLKPAKVIARPVRSGQQVYAEGSDLIITAAVSEGAEVIADGNIHVYGTLRGRAIAGAKGNRDARVFCNALDAELISIAGQFMMHDKIKLKCWKQPAQIYLAEETLEIEPLA